MYLQCNHNHKWQIFYAEDWDYSTELCTQILKDKKITEIALISNIVSSQERMYYTSNIHHLLKDTQKNQVKIITQATNLNLYNKRCILKEFGHLKKICLRGPTKYDLDFTSLPQLKEISYTIKTKTDKKEYGGKTRKDVRLEKHPEKNKIKNQATIYSVEVEAYDPCVEKSILEYVVMKLNSNNS